MNSDQKLIEEMNIQLQLTRHKDRKSEVSAQTPFLLMMTVLNGEAPEPLHWKNGHTAEGYEGLVKVYTDGSFIVCRTWFEDGKRRYALVP